MTTGFTPGERGYIRRELDMFFSMLPAVADGFQLRTWRSGPQAGQPKLRLQAKGLVEHGVMQLDITQRWPRLLFTEAGLAALRAMMMDRRLADPMTFAISVRNWASTRIPRQKRRRHEALETEPAAGDGRLPCRAAGLTNPATWPSDKN
jgi:hypothetical protein